MGQQQINVQPVTLHFYITKTPATKFAQMEHIVMELSARVTLKINFILTVEYTVSLCRALRDMFWRLIQSMQ